VRLRRWAIVGCWAILLSCPALLILSGGLLLAARARTDRMRPAPPAVEVSLVDLPGIQQPPALPAGVVKLPENAPVIGLAAGGRHRAYLLEALAQPEGHIVNDLLGGVPVTVAYCDALDCTRVFTELGATQALDIGIGGWIGHSRHGSLEGSMLLRVGSARYRQDNGRPLEAGAPLFPYTELKFVRQTWQAWRRAHPDTDVYLGVEREYLVDLPGVHYPPAVAAGSVKLPDPTPVIGVTAGGRHRAYLLEALARNQRHVVNDLLGNVPVTVTYCDALDCTRVFTEPGATQALDIGIGGWIGHSRHGSLKGSMLLRVGSARYRQDNGRPLEAGAAPFPCTELTFVRQTWQAWRRAHPDTDVYVGDPAAKSRETAIPVGMGLDNAARRLLFACQLCLDLLDPGLVGMLDSFGR
jgi:hypothetical protein